MIDQPTGAQHRQVLREIEYCGARSQPSHWIKIAEDTLDRLKGSCPSVLEDFTIGFQLDAGVLDDHLAPVYTLRSAVDRLAGVLEES